MYNRRDIREAAVQFLYFADLESGPEASSMEDAFWEIIQEQGLRKLEQAKAKAVLHVAQGRIGRLDKLGKHSEILLPKLKAKRDSDQLVDALNQLLSEESRMNDTVDLLKANQQKKNREPSSASQTDAILATNSSLTRRRGEFLQLTEDFPQWKLEMEPIVAAISYLERVSERISAIEDPQSTVGDFDHIRNSAKAIHSFREQTQKLVHGILDHKESIDKTLAGVIENYSPERVTPVDRAILRLATFEMTHCEDIPKAVSINEAIEISKRFSTTESSRFINGVLDAI
ncbi:MAG: transcription antitermination factor NusB [Akkermansiaceae bacterium]